MIIINHKVNGLRINQRREDGYINLTQMAKVYGKRLDNWLRLKDTRDLLAEFELQEKLNTSDVRDLKPALIVKRGKHEGGSWGHSDIAIQFAQWLDKKFALQVSRWVREWMTSSNNPISSQSMGNPIELLSGLEELEKLIIGIRSQALAVHTCAHQPVDELLAKSLHSLSHNQLNAIASAVHQMQTLKELGTMAVKMPVLPEIKARKKRFARTITQKKQLVSVNIKLPLSQKRWLAVTAQTIRQNNLQPLLMGKRVYPQHLIEVAVELLQNSQINLDFAYCIFLDLDESLANTNFKMIPSQQNWLAVTAQMIRNNCSIPTLPNERVYPQHLIGVAIDLLQNVDLDWSEVKNIEELKERLNL